MPRSRYSSEQRLPQRRRSSSGCSNSSLQSRSHGRRPLGTTKARSGIWYDVFESMSVATSLTAFQTSLKSTLTSTIVLSVLVGPGREVVAQRGGRLVIAVFDAVVQRRVRHDIVRDVAHVWFLSRSR